DLYTYVSGRGWLISSETWDFKSFNVEYSVFMEPPFYLPSPILKIGAASFSDDGEYLAAGSSDSNQQNGSVYLISLKPGAEGELWDRNTNNSAISSVAVSDNGTYVAAGGYWTGMVYGSGMVYLFNKVGNMLWNYSTGTSAVWQVSILPNGSGILAGDERGLIYFNDAGHVLWNYTFPYQGSSTRFAVSGNGQYIVVAVQNMLLPNETNFRWGVFYLNSSGHVLWSYTGDYSGVNYVQMSNNGQDVAVGTLVNGYNGSVYYFNGMNGRVLWKEQAYTAVQPLLMSVDGSHLASGGNVGVLLFNSKGNVLWNRTTGQPLGFIQGDPFVVVSEFSSCPNLVLVGYDGTTVLTIEVEHLTSVDFSQTNSEWVAFEGSIAGDGQCGAADLFNGTTGLYSVPIC
ncbi:MAG: hypothetical protein OK413_00465, partial [Thaumarchaeota archaeon]|nr:hypothetical protein [Nitrososphaerota archaeon]